MNSNLMVFIILGIAFVAVGIHLILYSKRQARFIRRFAAAEGYSYQERDDGTLASRLDKAFGITEGGYVRVFERIRDIVETSKGDIFRFVELLDLNPYASAQSPHHMRVGIHFSGLPDWYGVFHITPTLEAHQRYPIGGESVADQVHRYLVAAKLPNPPYPLSLTVSDGQALAYLEPAVVGSVTQSDLRYLADLAAQLSRHSSRPL